MKKLKLYGKHGNGKFAILNDEDFERFGHIKWNAAIYGYPQKFINNRIVLLHRLIVEAKASEHVDHIDGNPLNCTRDNLRVCEHKENMKNRKLNTNNTSGYKGVKRKGMKWEAVIYSDCKKYSLGSFIDKEEAARAYDKKAKELHGSFARVNGV